MANEQAGGPVPGAGQATTGEDTRKLTKGEAGFRENQGVAGLQCGDCRFFESGACQIVEGTIGQDDICDQFEPNTRDGNMTAEQATEVREKPMSAIEMFITRVSQDKQTGVRRWYATTSGTKTDLYGEKMSVALFRDFIGRIEERQAPPPPFTSEAWTGGLPYLGVAHYLDLNGAGIVGPTEKVWIDGKILKAKGTFENSVLAEKVFEAIQEDIATKRADEERVRISIAFIDWGHNHGRGPHKTFTRKSLSDQCMLCEAGVADKEYTAGHLVHFALTRRPAYPDTTIVALEEKSMSKRRDDAASIIGEELADDLEARSKQIIGRSTDEAGKVAAGAIVIKDESGGQEEEEAEVVGRTLGGAQNLDDAEAFLTKSEDDSILLDSWEILSTIIGNIAGEEHRAQIREVVRDFQSTLDVQTAQAVLEIQRALGGESVSEKTKEAVERQVPPQFRKDEEEEERQPEKEMAEGEEEEMDEDKEKEEKEDEEYEKKSIHPLDEAFAKVKMAYDDAIASGGDPGERLGMVQESFNSLGSEIRERVEQAAASAPVTADSINRMVADAVAKATAPLLAEITGLSATLQAGAKVEKSTSVIPSRRAIRMPPSTVPANPTIVTKSVEPSDDNPTPKLRDLVRKSTIGYEKKRVR